MTPFALLRRLRLSPRLGAHVARVGSVELAAVRRAAAHHYPTDVVAGMGLGVAVALPLSLLLLPR